MTAACVVLKALNKTNLAVHINVDGGVTMEWVLRGAVVPRCHAFANRASHPSHTPTNMLRYVLVSPRKMLTVVSPQDKDEFFFTSGPKNMHKVEE